MADRKADKNKPARLSRRAFIKGAGAAAAVAGLIGARPSASATEPEPSDQRSEGAAERLGPGPETIELMVNGATRRLTLEPRVTLLEALRDYLGLYGTKLVCDRGACGSCTVHLDGNPITSCMMLAVDSRGHEIRTIEGLGSPDHMHPVQTAFVEADALQCGFCTPGMIMSIAAALQRNPGLTLEEIKQAVAGNICRCGTYPHVFKAAMSAAVQLRGAKPPGGNA